MKVCVIGAGCSGLSAGKHLKEAGIDFVIFERDPNIGGIWNYNPKTEIETGHFVHSGVYDSLRINVAKETMQYGDYPFGDHLKGISYIPHTEMTRYYHSFVDHFDLRRFICLNHEVQNIRPLEDKVKPKWEVKVKNLPANQEMTLVFDSLIICVGHDSRPYFPPVPGLDEFSGTVIHSHHYRRRDMFKDKVVHTIGGNFSGVDISLDIAKAAKKVYVSTRNSHWRAPEKIHVVKPLEEVTEPVKVEGKKVYLKDGKVLEPDFILVATGYEFDMPFLSKECELTIHDRRIYPLFKHFVHPKWQNMYFIGVPRTVSQNVMSRHQSELITRLIQGKVTLPSYENMIKDTDEEYRILTEVNKCPHDWAHEKDIGQWELNREYAELGGFKPDPPVLQKLYLHLFESLKPYPDRYREANYEIVDDEHFRILDEVPDRGLQKGQIV